MEYAKERRRRILEKQALQRNKPDVFLASIGLGGFYVYRLYDAAGDLLYIGTSDNVKARVKTHYLNMKNNWILEVSRVEISEPYALKRRASAAEAKAIYEEKPRHNKVGRGG